MIDNNKTGYTNKVSDVIAAEIERINSGTTPEQARIASTSECLALALSGGGIRSASFAMGIMQALVASNKLEKLHYLSTVSGGGYLGASLTWFLSRRDATGKPRFGVTKGTFPFGEKEAGNKHGTLGIATRILNYLRLHGNYLIPGAGLDLWAFIAAVIRVVTASFLIYLALATLVIYGLRSWLVWLDLGFFEFFAGSFVVLVTMFSLISLVFSLLTFARASSYGRDVWVQRVQGMILKTQFGALVLALLPLIEQNLSAILTLAGGGNASLVFNGSVVVSSSTVGIIMGLMAHHRVASSNKPVSLLQINTSAFFLLFGLLFGAYFLAGLLLDYFGEFRHSSHVFQLIGVVVATLLMATVCNLNLFGLNRMYRNRLMESFMQEPEDLSAGVWKAAVNANKCKLADMCQTPNNRPYHLINANIVLADSDQAVYRGRMGDSFLFSPLYCGSDATGWRQTQHYMNKGVWNLGMTLPTAMAISGAAANPDAGVAGQGVTTDKLVSLIMSLLNLRLGFWAENPRMEPIIWRPNYLQPGLQAVGLFGDGLNEEQRFVELTDGGHFEDLATYELLRRRVKLIIVSDADEDGKFTFSDVANAVEKARVDFGIKIVFDTDYALDKLMPGSAANNAAVTVGDAPLAVRGFALATIYYPAIAGGAAASEGYLVYLKPTLTPGLDVDVMSYRRDHPDFPHQSTIDQFFDEVQFESYRELGYRLGLALIGELAVSGKSSNALLKQVAALL